MTAVSAPDSTAPRLTHRETLIVLVGLMLGMFLSALDQTIVATTLPQMSAELHGVGHLSWVVSGYLLTSTATTPIYGKLSDLYGRKIMLQVAVGIFLLTSILCAIATTMGQLIAFRALQGLGGGGLVAMAHATIADVISPRDRGRYQGYIAGTWGVASVVGPVLGGLFVEYLSWRWVFWINLPLGMCGLLLSQITLARLKPKRVRHSIDYLGALLIVAGVCCILLITTMGGNEVAWSSPVIVALGAAALVLFALCVLQELHAREAILPPRLFANQSFVFSNLVNLFSAICQLGSIIFLPLFLEMVYGLQPGDAGLMLIPLIGTSVVAAIVTGRRMSSSGRYRIFPILGSLLAVSGMMVLCVTSATTPLVLPGLAMATCGLGFGLIGPVLIVVVQNAVEPRDLGTATSSISFFRSMGGSFGVALFGAILIARLGALIAGVPGGEALGAEPGIQLMHAGAQALDLAPAALRPAVAAAIAHAFHDVFLVGAVIALLSALSAILLKEIPLKTTPGLAAGPEH